MTNREPCGLRIIMIGPLPPPLGGTTVSFQALCRYISPRAHTCSVIDTARRGERSLIAGLRTIVTLLTKLRQADVVAMHFSDRAAIRIGPALYLVSRLAGKRCVFRQFGGSFDRTVSELPAWYQAILSFTIFRSDAVFLQTKSMMETLRSRSRSLHWFPTARRKSEFRYSASFATGKTRVLKCLFLGQVSRAKGVLTAIRAVSQIDNVKLDIFGPIVDISEDELNTTSSTYCGSLPTDQVYEVMSQYDVLIFPTVYPGEGYSGTLVEASMVGLPIVATRWKNLPEMFSEEEVFFVNHEDRQDLPDVLRRILAQPESLIDRSHRLVERAADFSDEDIFGRFLEVCVGLAKKGRPPQCAEL